MGKTPVPLTILIDGEWKARGEFLALTDKGHVLVASSDPPNYVFTDLNQVDLVLSRKAHYWDDTMFAKPAYLDTALKVARARKKEAKTTDAPST